MHLNSACIINSTNESSQVILYRTRYTVTPEIRYHIFENVIIADSNLADVNIPIYSNNQVLQLK